MKNIFKRTLTAIVLVVFVILAVHFLPAIYFAVLLYLVIGLAVWELVRLVQLNTHSKVLLFFNGAIISLSFIWAKLDLLQAAVFVLITTAIFLLFSIKEKQAITTFVTDFGLHLIVYFYLYLPLFFIFKLKEANPFFLFFLILVILIGDSAAFFIGSLLGKRQAYPMASPNKTIEGVIAAVIFAGLGGILAKLLFPLSVTLLQAAVTGAAMGLLSQLSDPVESLFKRAGDEKDSGNLLPGHGGVLDRLDSYIFCAPTLFYLVKYFWKL